MEETEENMSAEDIQTVDSPTSVKIKPKKRSLVERELETNMTARVTSPITSDGSSTSRYGRARKLKTDGDMEAEKIMKPLKIDVSKQPQAYIMHASNSPVKDTSKKTILVGSSIADQIENIYNENISLSRFGSEEKANLQSPAKKSGKVYIRKDLIQKPDTDNVVLIKNLFSPNKPSSHLKNILERSSEKYALNGHGKAFNGFPDTSSVVKTLDFDGKKKKEVKEKVISKNELFEIEAACEYQVGDLAWARVGTYPFWPCIVTRDPFSDMFVKKKLFGRVERSVIHVTFFGDNGRRGWIVDNMLRKYHGRAEFESCRDKFTPESKKKDPRFYAAHFVSDKKLHLWNISVEEAETLMKEPKRLRIDILYDMLEKTRAVKTTPLKRDTGGKITRTGSDVSLSESLYDTLFSEDDGKADDRSSKRARNKSLDVSEVVTACLDNMAARSGIIQIQRQSHMDRWLQKAKSKTPEKMQPKLYIKVEKEKRKDRMKKKESKKSRKNESLGSDATLLPYQNEHDYSSVNYENHNINDSSNKNTDSASGLDSTLNSSDIGVVVKIESLSSSMDDSSQYDIITTVVNDDIIMTDPENVSKDNFRDNNNVHKTADNHAKENELVKIKDELPENTGDLKNSVQPRRSKRKRQTLEGLNNSITENKAKEPKLDLTETYVDPMPNCVPKCINTEENIETYRSTLTVTNAETPQSSKSVEETSLSCNSEPVLVSKPQVVEAKESPEDKEVAVTPETNIKQETLQNSITKSNDLIPSSSLSTPVVDIPPLENKEDANKYPDNSDGNNLLSVTTAEKETPLNSSFQSSELLVSGNFDPVVVIEPLKNKLETEEDPENALTNFSTRTRAKTEEKETVRESQRKSNRLLSLSSNSKLELLEKTLERNITGREMKNTTEYCTATTVPNIEKEPSQNDTITSNEFIPSSSLSTPVVDIPPLENKEDKNKDPDNSDGNNVPSVTTAEKETPVNSSFQSSELLVSGNFDPVVVIETLTNKLETEEDPENALTNFSTRTRAKTEDKETVRESKRKSNRLLSLSSISKLDLLEKTFERNSTGREMKNTKEYCTATTVPNLDEEPSQKDTITSNEFIPSSSLSTPVVDIQPLENKEDTNKYPDNSYGNNLPSVTTAEKETPLNSSFQSSELLVSGNFDPVVVIEPLTNKLETEEDPENALTNFSTRTIATTEEIETVRKSKRKSNRLLSLSSNSKLELLEKTLERNSTGREMKNTTEYCTATTVPNLEEEPSQNDTITSNEFIPSSSLSTPVVDIPSLENKEDTNKDPDNSDGNNVLSVTTAKKETPLNSSFQSSELLVSGNYDPVVVIEPLTNKLETEEDPENALTNFSTRTIATTEEIETVRKSKRKSNRLLSLSSNSKLELLEKTLERNSTGREMKNTTEYCTATTVPNLEEEPSQNDTITSNEFISLSSNTKPIVVIEPLDMNGLDTQIIIRGCKQLVPNKFLDSAINLKTSANRLSQNNMVSKETNSIDEQGADVNDVLKDCHPKTKVDVCVSVVDKKKTSTTDSTDLVADAISDPVKVTEPKKSLFDEIRNTNGLTKVVIGDELYIFDRTLSQDYDEIDGDRCDEVTSSIISENLGVIVTKDDNVVRADSSSHKETLQNSTEDNTETIECKTKETVLISNSADLSSKTDCGSLSIPTNDKIIADLFENNSDVQSDTSFDIGDLQKQTDKDSSMASNVSSEVFDEPNEVSNEGLSEENNDRCVFLDQRLKIPNAQSADGITKKTKPRFRLNRTRHCSLKLKLNVGKVLEMKENSLDKVKSEHVQKTKSTNCNSNEHCKSKRENFSKVTEDSKKTMKNPEFLKYMEIRKDALLDDQPDLSQDEIVTYLYKQWVYEEGNKSDVKKIDDKVGFKLVEDVHQKQLSQAKKDTPTLESYFIKVDTHTEKNNLVTPLSRPDDRVSSVTKNTKYSNVTMNTEDTNKFEENINSELRVPVTFQINCNNKIARKSLRKSKEKLVRKMTINQPQEMTDLEKKSVLETVLNYDSATSAEEKQCTSTTQEEEFKEKIDPEKCTQETVRTDSTTKQLNSNELFITEHEVSAEQINSSKKAMHAPEFIKYIEIHQDALLDEQPDLTHDEIVTYLHQKWLYEEGNKSDAKKIDDKEQSYLVKDCNQKPAPSAKKLLVTLKKCFKKVITDQEKGISGKVALTTTEVPVTEDSKEKSDTEETINDVEKTDVEKCVTDTVSLNSNNRTLVLTRRASRRSKDKQVTKKIINDSMEGTNLEKPTVETVAFNCNDSAKSSNEKKEDGKIIKNKLEESHKKKTVPENLLATSTNDSQMSVTKQIELSKEKQDTRNTTSNPEFIKYLEIHQDALLDEQPDLTLDEIETYLYKKWIYEEDNKSDMKKLDDSQQSNLVKGIKQEPLPQQNKLKKKPKLELASDFKSVDIRDIIQKNTLKLINHANDIQLNIIDASTPTETSETEKSNSLKEKHTSIPVNNSSDNDETHKKSMNNAESKINKGLCDKVPKESKNSSKKEGKNEENHQVQVAGYSAPPITLAATANLEQPVDIDWEACIDELGQQKDESYCSTDSVQSKIINGFIEFEVNQSVIKTEVIDPVMVSVKTEDSGISTGRKSRKEKDIKKSMDDPEFIKYLEARQDALIDEQPDLTQEEIVTYLYQTWFYEESTKSDVKKSDETEQSNLVKGLNQDPVPQPRKYKKKPKVEKEKIEIPKSEKALKNADIRDTVHKPKRKITQSKPYYNEDDSDLEEEDLETFKIFDRDEQNEEGEEIDEVELYFEQLTKPKPNVFKGYVRERVCEICYRAGNIVKCKSCHGMFHVECVKKETEVTETTAQNNRGRKKKRGRKPKNYDPSLDSQSDERSQDANNSEELNVSLEEESESHIVIDADDFETLWENKLKEITEIEDEYDSDQEINWEVKPGHCEIVDLKQKEKPIDYSDYKCNNCLKYETPVCFVCQSNKSPKGDTDVRQKCQVAHCHRYYHLECLDHWPQTQFNSWEPSKTNKKQIEYIEALSCPRHVCHTCVSDDPRGCKTRFSGDKLARCVKCPATYHSFTKCLPAGTQILTGSQIICPRHYEHRPGKVPCHVNTGWCFICALGGTLICCEYCPTSFHAECLNIKPPEGSYMCEDCETGRLPVYGEMVWVKLGHYRWWPGIVLHPTEIPDNIWAVKHSPGEFVVRFFGQYDHYWVNRGRVFPFQEGDSGRISSQKSKIDAAFTMAMEHAQRACEILKKMQPNEEEDLDIASSLLPPHYVKLKVNKPAGNVARKDMDANSLTQCDCNPSDPDPCGPYTHCLNRMLLTECGPLCRAGERCNNRAFEKRLYPKLQAYRTPHRGWGLRTLEDIKQGQFVIEYVGELIDLEEFRRRMCRKHEIRDENFYFLALDNERMIDAGPKGNLARFMNHCCEPNCETQKWTVLGDVRVGLFALRDVPANSEVTFNYHLECAGIEKKRCLCGARRCSGYIGAKPKQLLEDQAKKTKPPTKRTYKKRKPVEESSPSPSTSKPKVPKIKIKLIKPKELTEIEKDLLIINNATNGLSSDSEVSLSVEDKNTKVLSLKRKRVSFSTEEVGGKKAKLETEYVIEA